MRPGMTTHLFALLLGACGFGLAPNVDKGSSDDDDDGPSGFNLCGAPDPELRAAGTWRDPIEASTFPFMDRGDTSLSEELDGETWDCGQIPRGGAEVVYKLRVPEGAALRAELRQDEGATLTMQFTNARPSGGEVTGCTDFADSVLEVAAPEAGTWYLVVDTPTPDGTGRPGPYTLLVDLVKAGEWQERDFGAGVTWSRLGGPGALGRQNFNLFAIDTSTQRVRPRPHYDCQTVPTRIAELTGPRIGVALGASDESCSAGNFAGGAEFFRMDGETIRVNNYADPARAVGWSDGEEAETRSLLRGSDWTEVANGFAGFPALVSGGNVALDPPGSDALYTERRARTAAGVNSRGELLIFTADGPHARAEGLTLQELAQVMADAGAQDAVNLGGSGTVTAWASGCGFDGIVNWPLDGGGSTRDGARPVQAGLYVF